MPLRASAWVVPLAHGADILADIGDQEYGVDRLIDATGLPSQVVIATLMKLEMRWLVRALPGFRQVKR